MSKNTPRTRKTVSTIWPDEMLFWKIQIVILLSALIISLGLQTGFAFWKDPDVLSKGLPFSWLLTILSVLIVSVPAFIHGYFEIAEPWRLTENRIMRKGKEVLRLYELASVKPGIVGLTLNMHDGATVYMMYVTNRDDVADVIARTAQESVKKLSL